MHIPVSFVGAIQVPAVEHVGKQVPPLQMPTFPHSALALEVVVEHGV
jgi:hypothetical protein